MLLSISKEVERKESFAFLVRINYLAHLKKNPIDFFLKKKKIPEILNYFETVLVVQGR